MCGLQLWDRTILSYFYLLIVQTTTITKFETFNACANLQTMFNPLFNIKIALTHWQGNTHTFINVEFGLYRDDFRGIKFNIPHTNVEICNILNNFIVYDTFRCPNLCIIC